MQRLKTRISLDLLIPELPSSGAKRLPESFIWGATAAKSIADGVRVKEIDWVSDGWGSRFHLLRVLLGFQLERA
jgi:hypothetical protein